MQKSTTLRLARAAGLGVLILALAGCSAYASRRDNTVIGAGLGAVAGAALSDGDPLMMLGGAAAGGLLGNVLTDDRRYSRSSYRSYRSTPTYRSTPRYGYSYGNRTTVRRRR